VSELIIGLSIVAVGTSLPEIATSIIATLRGERDIAVGNVVGSNLFNILAVLGLSSVVSPSGVAVAPEALRFDLPVMIGAAIACLPIFFTGNRIARWEGALFFAYYPYHLSVVHDFMKSGQRQIILQAPHQATQSPFEPGHHAAVKLSEAPMVRIGLFLSFFSSTVG